MNERMQALIARERAGMGKNRVVLHLDGGTLTAIEADYPDAIEVITITWAVEGKYEAGDPCEEKVTPLENADLPTRLALYHYEGDRR